MLISGFYNVGLKYIQKYLYSFMKYFINLYFLDLTTKVCQSYRKMLLEEKKGEVLFPFKSVLLDGCSNA